MNFFGLSRKSMAGDSWGRGDCSDSPSCKSARHDAEASNTKRAGVEPWCSQQVRECVWLFRSGGRGVSDRFFELDEVLFLHTKRCRDVDKDLLAAQDAVAAVEDGATERLKVAKEEHAYTHAWRRSAFAFYLDVQG